MSKNNARRSYQGRGIFTKEDYSSPFGKQVTETTNSELKQEDRDPEKGSMESIVKEAGSQIHRVLLDWQRERNKGVIDETKAHLPLLKTQQRLKYSILFLILIITLILSYISYLNAQFTVALLSAIVGYIFGEKTIFSKKS